MKALAALRRRIPPASSTTIVGVSTLVGVASSIVLRRLGYPEEAGVVVGAVWSIIHPQIDARATAARPPS